MKYAVITGASKGLGTSLARLFMESGVHVIGVSRNDNDQLAVIAQEHNVSYTHFPCDLQDMDKLQEATDRVTAYLEKEKATTVYLINNAGTLDPIGPSGTVEARLIERHIAINLTAPMTFTNAFINWADKYGCHLLGVMVTSGAAKRPNYGWSAYCSTKAGLNMFMKTIAQEQVEKQTNHKFIAFSPGIMDTGMQEKIRASAHEDFVEVETFRNYKQKNLLKDTEVVGGVLVDIVMDESNLESGKIYDVADYV